MKVQSKNMRKKHPGQEENPVPLDSNSGVLPKPRDGGGLLSEALGILTQPWVLPVSPCHAHLQGVTS